MEEFQTDPSRRASFGKIEAIMPYQNGSCVLVLTCPMLEEIYDELDVYHYESIDLTEAEIPEDIEEQVVDALYASEEFSEFVAQAILASEMYAEEYDMTLVTRDAAGILKNIKLKPSIKREGSEFKVSITGTLTIPLKIDDGDKYTTNTCHCGDTYKDKYTAAIGHDYQEKFDDNKHWKQCKNCSAVINEANHSWNNTYSTDAEKHWIGCAGCAAKKGEGNHDGGIPSCTELAICYYCNQPYGETIPHNCIRLMELTIPASVTYIGPFALRNANYLETIYFEGTEEKWNAIYKGSNWNTSTGSKTANGTYTLICCGDM